MGDRAAVLLEKVPAEEQLHAAGISFDQTGTQMSVGFLDWARHVYQHTGKLYRGAEEQEYGQKNKKGPYKAGHINTAWSFDDIWSYMLNPDDPIAEKECAHSRLQFSSITDFIASMREACSELDAPSWLWSS